MLTDGRFWFGLLLGAGLLYGYQKYQAQGAQ